MSNRAVFFDRDGTLIEHYDYLTDPSQVNLLPTTVSALRLLREHDFVLVIATNQSAVARGMLSEEKLVEIHDRLKSLIAEEGAYVDQIYYCPYHPEGAVEKYRRESKLRKPAPGMLQLAAEELDLDLSQCWIVGDDDRDIETGQSVGCRTILLESRSSSPLVKRGKAIPDFHAVNLQEAANLIIRYADQPIVSMSADAASAPEQINPSLSNEQQPKPPLAENIHSQSDHDQLDSVELDAKKLRDHEIARRKARRKTTLETDLPAFDGDSEPVQSESDEQTHSEALLNAILRELKALNRHQNFTDFSVFKMLAALVQMVVVLCVILAFWFWSSPEPRPNAVHTCLLLAVVFQTLTLTLLITHKQQ